MWLEQPYHYHTETISGHLENIHKVNLGGSHLRTQWFWDILGFQVVDKSILMLKFIT